MTQLEKTHATRLGLDNVTVAETRISAIDGDAGSLTVRGHRLEELVEQHDFEAASHLLITGTLPSRDEKRTWSSLLGKARAQAAERLERPLARSAMNTVVRELAALDDLVGTFDLLRSAEVIATVAVAGTAWIQRQQGNHPLKPDPRRPHAEDVLRLATGVTASRCVRALECYLVTALEHGMNASTFATRVVASTGSDLPSAVTAGMAALTGPLHGGAPGPVLDMLDAIGNPEKAGEWLEHELSEGRRIMGFGHRVYRVRDPRAEVLEAALSKHAPNTERLKLARGVEQHAVRLLAEKYPGRELHANVEFYTALLLEALGISRSAFSVMFASARVVGWCAHYFEQQREGRLLRPRARYIGPPPPPPAAPPLPV